MITAQLPKDFNVTCFPHAKGVDLFGSEIRFDKSFTVAMAEEFLKNVFASSMPDGSGNYRIKQYGAKSAKPLTDEELTAYGIKPMAGTKHYKLLTSSTTQDRDGDKYTKAFFDMLVKSFEENGTIGLHFNHDKNSIIGTVVKAFTEPGSTSNDGTIWNYIQIARIDDNATVPGQNGITVQRAIENEMLKHVSMGFFAEGTYIESTSATKGFILWDYNSNMTMKPENFETSLVYFPAQYGAAVKTKKFYGGQVFEYSSELFSLKEVSQTKKFIQKMKKTINGKTFEFSVKSEGETLSIIGDEAGFDAEIKALETDSAQLKTLKEAYQKITEPIINDIQNLEGEKALNKSFKHTADELTAMPYEKVIAIQKDLQEQFKAKTNSSRFTAAGEEETAQFQKENSYF